MTNRWAILALIMAAQTVANVGPLGIPSIAPLIREDLGLSMAQAGSFISAYYIGPSLMSLPAGWMADRDRARAPGAQRPAAHPQRARRACGEGPGSGARALISLSCATV